MAVPLGEVLIETLTKKTITIDSNKRIEMMSEEEDLAYVVLNEFVDGRNIWSPSTIGEIPLLRIGE